MLLLKSVIVEKEWGEIPRTKPSNDVHIIMDKSAKDLYYTWDILLPCAMVSVSGKTW